MTRTRKLGKGILVFVVLVVLFLGLFVSAKDAINMPCVVNEKIGKCMKTSECTGASVASTATMKTECSVDSRADVQCCIPKEDAGSATIQSPPATVTFKSEPITLISDRVFMETYDKKSKIIDASKITYEGEPIFKNAACVLNNDNPNTGGRVEVTVKVFNNIDEQIDTMTFVMKAGGDLWEYAECADGKGICVSDTDRNSQENREVNEEKQKDCYTAYKDKINVNDAKRILCYTEKSGTGVETKTDEKNNDCVKFEGYECIELKDIKGSILSYKESNGCKVKSDCQGNNCCGSTDDYLCCKKNS